MCCLASQYDNKVVWYENLLNKTAAATAILLVIYLEIEETLLIIYQHCPYLMQGASGRNCCFTKY